MKTMRLHALLWILPALLACPCADMLLLERRQQVVRHHTIGTSGSVGRIRAMQFSDTHLGDAVPLAVLRRVVDAIRRERPDLVAFTGDLPDKAGTCAHLEDTQPCWRN